jgi:hypothetical protein
MSFNPLLTAPQIVAAAQSYGWLKFSTNAVDGLKAMNRDYNREYRAKYPATRVNAKHPELADLKGREYHTKYMRLKRAKEANG